ncbi:hypothetical protein GPECTOR_36g133 [Gonium pectorale]|uniref:Non-specific serine/threonine protein kinase n=1 Tax=Gonium pectorale TaxID=33097 RepID=A0A150GBS0_GONPE|nr:hypothetical protein GPECTOR_36g133 [Gonium pectorale]|eukprot:KXZ47282.1 hypothetical protein GPECTOR_36g133 [Gonium pectorale]
MPNSSSRQRYLHDTAKQNPATDEDEDDDDDVVDGGRQAYGTYDSCVHSFHVAAQQSNSLDGRQGIPALDSPPAASPVASKRHAVAPVAAEAVAGAGRGAANGSSASLRASAASPAPGNAWGPSASTTAPPHQPPTPPAPLQHRADSLAAAAGRDASGASARRPRGSVGDGGWVSSPQVTAPAPAPASTAAAAAAASAMPQSSYVSKGTGTSSPTSTAATASAPPSPPAAAAPTASAPSAATPPQPPAEPSVQWVIRPGPPIETAYALGKVLGKGSFGVVRAATHLATNSQVAVKTIRKSLLGAADVSSLRREVEILHHLSGHPNISQLLGVFEETSQLHLVIELYQDIKPENFMLTAPVAHPLAAAGDLGEAAEEDDRGAVGSRLKLIDFGLSVFCTDSTPMTETVGTSYYVAPEVLQRSYSRSADVWSAGVILHILLTGYAPFDGRNDQEILRAVQNGRLDLTTDPIWLSISREARAVLTSMLDRNPATRATADQLLAMPWLGRTAAACTAPSAPLPGVVSERMRRFSRMHSFAKEARRVVAGMMRSEEVAGLVAQFKGLDADGDGKLSVRELKEGLARQELQAKAAPGGAPPPALGSLGGTASGRTGLGEEELRELVERTDLDGDGMLDQSEFLGAALSTATIRLQAQQALAAAAAAGGGAGAPGGLARCGSTGRANPLAAAFAHFDKDGSGFITADELRSALAAHHPSGKGPDIQALLACVDQDSDGRISYPEFVAMLVQEVGDDDKEEVAPGGADVGGGGIRRFRAGKAVGTAKGQPTPAPEQQVADASQQQPQQRPQQKQQQPQPQRHEGEGHHDVPTEALPADARAIGQVGNPAGANPNTSFVSTAAVHSLDWYDECNSNANGTDSTGTGTDTDFGWESDSSVGFAAAGARGNAGAVAGGGATYVPSRLSVATLAVPAGGGGIKPDPAAGPGLVQVAEEAAAAALIAPVPGGAPGYLLQHVRVEDDGPGSAGRKAAGLAAKPLAAEAAPTAPAAASPRASGGGIAALRPPAILVPTGLAISIGPAAPRGSHRSRRHSAAAALDDDYRVGFDPDGGAARSGGYGRHSVERSTHRGMLPMPTPDEAQRQRHSNPHAGRHQQRQQQPEQHHQPLQLPNAPHSLQMQDAPRVSPPSAARGGARHRPPPLAFGSPCDALPPTGAFLSQTASPAYRPSGGAGAGGRAERISLQLPSMQAIAAATASAGGRRERASVAGDGGLAEHLLIPVSEGRARRTSAGSPAWMAAPLSPRPLAPTVPSATPGGAAGGDALRPGSGRARRHQGRRAAEAAGGGELLLSPGREPSDVGLILGQDPDGLCDATDFGGFGVLPPGACGDFPPAPVSYNANGSCSGRTRGGAPRTPVGAGPAAGAGAPTSGDSSAPLRLVSNMGSSSSSAAAAFSEPLPMLAGAGVTAAAQRMGGAAPRPAPSRALGAWSEGGSGNVTKMAAGGGGGRGAGAATVHPHAGLRGPLQSWQEESH